MMSGAVFNAQGQRLYGMDAELHLKIEGKRDAAWELEVARWMEALVEEHKMLLVYAAQGFGAPEQTQPPDSLPAPTHQ